MIQHMEKCFDIMMCFLKMKFILKSELKN